NDDGGPGPRIPQVLEKILQLKEQRQVELTASAEASDDADATVGATLTPADTEEEEVASSQSKKEVCDDVLFPPSPALWLDKLADGAVYLGGDSGPDTV
ncbi:hypothetical protein chiPu_0029345, partial [Chiloscyllium punctatum]|nr:hypothetical protein [Chiloscyllium punctatum]